MASKPDSHDICFIADGDTRGFLSARIGASTGPIVDAGSGAVVGTHGGSFGFTVGQRHGLHLDRPAPDGRPRYVLAVQPRTNTVVVGPASALATDEIFADRIVWGDGQPPVATIDCQVQVRAHGAAIPAQVTCRGDDVQARLAVAQRGVAAGQAMVMYAGDVVLGAATVRSAQPVGVAV